MSKPYTVLLARPATSADDCDTFLCFVHADDPHGAHMAAAVEAIAADGSTWHPEEYRPLAIFEGFHPDVSA